MKGQMIMETIIYKALKKWANKIPSTLYRNQLIFQTKNGESTGKITGEAFLYNGLPPNRDLEWIDYISLRDKIDYSNKEKPILTKDQYNSIEARI